MSKRHGATGTIEYQRLGYTPAGMRNYLARLGWSHGDDEFFSTSDAIAWFNLTGINKSPARFDFKKLDNINGKHINSSNDSELIEDINRFNDVCEENNLNSFEISKVEKALYCLKQNSKKIPDLLNKAHFFLIDRPVDLEERAKAALSNSGIHILKELTPFLEDATWTREGLEFAVNNYLADRHLKLGQLVQPLKAALSGRMSTPSVFDMMVLLGPNEVNERICDMAHKAIS